jgi:hypothetical protein
MANVPEGPGYTLKRRLLGPPMVNEQLSEERLSKPLALGVLSPDGISSSAYGSEEILIELLKGGLGVAAFSVLLPLTGVVLFVLALVVLSYREVVTVYTRTGGSYVVARENFGPKVAQIAAVALLIDYTSRWRCRRRAARRPSCPRSLRWAPPSRGSRRTACC